MPSCLNAGTEICFFFICERRTCSVRCVTCASSSFSPLAGVGVAGIFLADEGLDVGVEDLGVVELDLDAPTAEDRFITREWMKDFFNLFLINGLKQNVVTYFSGDKIFVIVLGYNDQIS